MIPFKRALLALSIGFACNIAALAADVSNSEYQKDKYKADKEKVSIDYKAAMAFCAGLAGNLKDICVVDAKGKEKVSLAELEDYYHPTRKTRFEVAVAKAEGTYAVAKERCDDKAGNVSDICLKEAKSVETAAKADAMAKMEISDANAAASEQSTTARKDANEERRSGEYTVAKEKCYADSGDTRDACLEKAKVRFVK